MMNLEYNLLFRGRRQNKGDADLHLSLKASEPEPRSALTSSTCVRGRHMVAVRGDVFDVRPAAGWPCRGGRYAKLLLISPQRRRGGAQ